MVKNVTKLRVFVASPGDVSEERDSLKKVIEELNHGIADDKGLMLQYVGWETDAWPGFGEDAQDVINKEIGPYDIFIGIMWKHFGTPTKRAGSGTEEEFNQAYNFWLKYGRPRIMLYFNSAPFFPSTADETEQLTKVLEFKEKVGGKGALFWDYKGPEEFKKFVRQHLEKEILKPESYTSLIPPPPVFKLPLHFYQGLFKELDMYITQFEQMQRDYGRELKGKRIVFAVDFSEVHNYMYPYSLESPRSSLNQYIFNTIKNPLTLMPGAVGELLTDLERALPPPDVLEQDPISIYKDVAVFISSFFSVINDEEEIVRLYSLAERQLKKAWRELFNLVIQDESYTALYAVKSLIDRGKLTPIKGVREITNFPFEVKQRAQSVRNYLDIERPGRIRNNQVDTIDFAVTWLLNAQKQDRKKRYFSIYTQSQCFINACTTRHNLRWEDDFLVRGAQYFKFRTILQELLPSTRKRKDFVVNWAAKCKKLQMEISNLIQFQKESSILKTPSLLLLDLYRQFDVECRIPLTFTAEAGEVSKSDMRKKASKLYALLKENGEFRGRTSDAFEVLKRYLKDLQKDFTLFSPEKVQAKDSKIYMEKLAEWIDSESLDENKKREEEK